MLKCVILKVNLKAILKIKEKPKSKLGLPRVTMGLDKSFNQSLRDSLKMVSCMSSYGPPRDYYGVLKEHLKTCVEGLKWRAYRRIPRLSY